MNINISKSDVIWNYFGYIMKFSSSVIFFPILLKKLPSDELGVWYVFLSLGALIQLLDLGFTPTIMRNISYAFSGATKLRREGVESHHKLHNGPNYELIFELISISRKIYLYIALIALALLLTIGTYYIYSITKHMSNSNVLFAWFVYSLGIFFNFYYAYWIPILNGLGKIKEAQHAVIISQVMYLFIGLSGIVMSFGLLAIAVAFCTSGIIIRSVSKFYFKRDSSFWELNANKSDYKGLFGIIWHNAKKIGLVYLGGFLIMQANTLICSIYFDLSTIAKYGLTLQLFNIVAAISGITFRCYLPAINEARVRSCRFKLKKYLALTTVIGWVSYVICSFIIIFFGELLLIFIDSNTFLLSRSMLIFMAFYLFLEFNHSNYATFILSNNEVPFVKSSLLSGFGIILVSLIFLNYSSLGIWSILISQATVQLLYNNWKWPKMVMDQLNLSWCKLILIGFKESNKILFRKRGKCCEIS